MKKILLLLALLPLMASAYEAQIDGIYYYFHDTEATVTYYVSYPSGNKNGYKGSINIPETVVYYGNTYRVTAVGESAFAGCSEMTSITIPNSVTSIGAQAFSSCYSLTSLTIPNSVIEIGEWAFSDCSSLTSITIPNSVTTIGTNSFVRCSGELTINCNIPDASSTPSVFLNSNFSSVTIGDDVELIGNGAFNGCSSITSITIGKSVTSIGQGAFSKCAITSVNIPSSVTSIGDNAFSDCKNLTEVHITDIASWCMINFPDQYANPLYHAKHLFMNDKEISEVVIPNTATSIGNYAFYNCSGLTSVTIPNTVTSIGWSAFEECKALTSVTIPNSVTSIGQCAFYNCSSLTSVNIPNSVTTIGWIAFYGCSGLKSMTIGKSVKDIGDGAFKGCSGELTVNCNIPSASSYSKGLFYDTKFSSVTIGDDVESIGDYAFYLCTSITSLTLGKNVTSIGEKSFYNCTGLKDIYCYASKVPNTGKDVFYKVPTSVVTLHVPEASVGIYKATSPWSNFVKYEAMNIEPEPAGIAIDDTNFPDENFRNWILSQEYGLDGVLSDEEIANIKRIWVTNLDIHTFKGIEYLSSLIYLDCSNNPLESIDISKNTALSSFVCSRCNLTSLDVSKNRLTWLNCEGNQLTTLDLSKNTELTTLRCSYNQLTSLDLSQNKDLTYLGCHYNQLTSLDVSNNTKLTSISCYKNQLASIDVSKNTVLTSIYFYLNKVKDAGMDAFVASLPTVSDGVLWAIYTDGEENVMTTTQVNAANAKGWTVYHFDGEKYWPEYEGSEPEVMKCATPVVAFYDGKLVFMCETEDVEYKYQIATPLMSEFDGTNVSLPTKIQLIIYATKDGYEPSDTVTKEIDLKALIGQLGDVNGDGEIGMADIMYMVQYILNGKFPDEE